MEELIIAFQHGPNAGSELAIDKAAGSFLSIPFLILIHLRGHLGVLLPRPHSSFICANFVVLSERAQAVRLYDGSQGCIVTLMAFGRIVGSLRLAQFFGTAGLLLSGAAGYAGVSVAEFPFYNHFPVWHGPDSTMIVGSDGNFYGVSQDGNYGRGTVFRVGTNGVLRILHIFDGSRDGSRPAEGLVEGSDGYFYGTCARGGSKNHGTVFRFNTNGVLTSLYEFTARSDGALPMSGLVRGDDGGFYGTTYDGGVDGSGTVFQILANGKLTSLYSFGGESDGAHPAGTMVQSGDGLFYGTTFGGGTHCSGTVFQISANGELSTLHSFTGGKDGSHPGGRLIMGNDGCVYGTTHDGGAHDHGTVFKITSSRQLTTLVSFGGSGGSEFPDGGLLQARDGKFYGVSSYGGTNGHGTLFRIGINEPSATLYSFAGGPDGGHPGGALVQGRDGHLYGATRSSGRYGHGTVFNFNTHGTLYWCTSFEH